MEVRLYYIQVSSRTDCQNFHFLRFCSFETSVGTQCTILAKKEKTTVELKAKGIITSRTFRNIRIEINNSNFNKVLIAQTADRKLPQAFSTFGPTNVFLSTKDRQHKFFFTTSFHFLVFVLFCFVFQIICCCFVAERDEQGNCIRNLVRDKY